MSSSPTLSPRAGVIALGLAVVLGAVAQAGSAAADDMGVSISTSPSYVGMPADFQIYATNQGSGTFGLGGGSAAARVKVTIDVPAAFTPQSFTAPGWACTMASHSVVCIRGGVLTSHQQYPAIYVHTMQKATGHYRACAHLVILPGSGFGSFDTAPGNNDACQDGDVTVPPPTCLKAGTMPNSPPLMITGTGMGNTPLDADTQAYGDWRSKVMNISFAYADWARAHQKTSSCTHSGSTYTCVRKAQPCK